MKQTKIMILVIVTAGLFFILPLAFASSNANIVYYETALGNGLWKYDYTLFNNSTSGENLYSIWFDFNQSSIVNGSPLPIGWNGSVWYGTNTTTFLNTFSTDPSYDIAAGSSLNGFSFTINYREGDIPYTAYFDDHSGNITTTSGTTFSLVPEPISSVLFIAGGLFLTGKRYLRKKSKA